jgi:hypothetical protein
VSKQQLARRICALLDRYNKQIKVRQRHLETKGAGNDNTTPPSKTDEVRNALTQLKAKGIKDWEILDIWAQILHEQGDYAIAVTLESAAYELGKPID